MLNNKRLLWVLAAVCSFGLAGFAGAQPWSLTVDVRPVGYQGLAGVGTGTVTLNPPGGSYADGTIVQITVAPDPNNFVFEWTGDIPEGIGDAPHLNLTTFSVTMEENSREIQVLLSREYQAGDEVGDLDQDGLPDEWEVEYGLDPKDPSGANGAFGNPDGDFLPWTSWPLPANLLSDGGYSANRVPFNNILEARGFDGIYTTIPGDPGSGSPGTNPTEADTDGDGLPDGWEYYFWALRGAGAAVPVGCVTIDPLNPATAFNDDDGDGLTNLQEYEQGTDPTHADTDRDGMDDGWEVAVGLNPIDATGSNGADGNPDGDWMAYTEINGIPFYHAGVYGASAPTMEAGDTLFDPRTAWDHGTRPDTVAYSNYDEYLGADRLPQKTWDADGCIIDPNFSNDATDPLSVDTDGDGIPDGWELYVGMNPLDPGDAGNDPDGDGLSNLLEWANQTSEFGQSSALGDWTNKLWPTDPGVADRVFAWQNVWFDINGDGIYDDGLDVQIWDGGHADGWTTPDQTVGRSNPRRPSRVDGISDAPIVYDSVNNSAWADIDGDNVFTTGVDVPSSLLPPNDGDAGSSTDLYFYHNDFHPRDTDFDGFPDSTTQGGGERAANTNPTAVDTDGDKLPDGWERYAGTDPLEQDATDDPDGDGLLNYQEYMTGFVFEWNHIDPRWPDVPGVEYGEPRMATRQPMRWDGNGTTRGSGQIPFILQPDFETCPSFNVSLGQRASTARAWQWYKTTLAESSDSDSDGMDDYWEVFHGLNPIKGSRDFMTAPNPSGRRPIGTGASVGDWDADPLTAGVYEMGVLGVPFTSVSDLVASLDAGWAPLHAGPFNFGLELMDPDADGIPNIEEYSYEWPPDGRVYHHTDPTPYQRTNPYGTDPLGLGDPYSFSLENYTFDNITQGRFVLFGWPRFSVYDGFVMPFSVGVNEGFDTDNDGRGDLSEIARIAELDSVGNTDPVNSMDPMQNRAVRLERENQDFLRTMGAWAVTSPLNWFTRFTVEAWVYPGDIDSPEPLQIITERAARIPNMWGGELTRANFSLGIDTASRRPFVMYNGRGAFDTTIVQAGPQKAIKADEWTHLAGVYNGTHLRLYVNGELAGQVSSAMLPATGAPTASGGFFRTGSTVVGARENLTAGASVFDWATLAEPLDVNSFYDGWIDEVRVWNGARDQGEIQATMRSKLPRVVDATTAQLAHYFSFDDNPDIDVNWQGGINQPLVPPNMEYLQGPFLPVHQTLDIWANTPQRSTIYTGHPLMPYNYIVYAKDLHAQAPVVPPEDDRVNMIQGEDGSISLPVGYKNSSNPYAFGQTHNLLFMNSAEADGDVFTLEAWMTGLPMDNPDEVDSNGDGIPDWWYIEHGFDPYGPSIAFDDPDGDGLWNINEYRAGLNPHLRDTLGDGVMDGERDFDGDGLSNLYEQNISGSRVDFVDTDDDGYTDWEEAMGMRLPRDGLGNLLWSPFDPLPAVEPGMISNPAHSLDPIKRNSMRVSGDGHMAVRDQERHALSAWTVQAWVWPDPGSEGIVLRRRVFNNLLSQYGVNYELGVELDGGFLRPYVRYIRFNGGLPQEVKVNGTAPQEVTGGQLVTTLIPVEEWTHLAGTYDPETTTLSLYINGELSAYRVDAGTITGLGIDEDDRYRGELTVGGGHLMAGVVTDPFSGYIDEVVIANGAMGQDEIRSFSTRANSVSAAMTFAPPVNAYEPIMMSIEEALEHDHASDHVLVRFKEGVTVNAVDDLSPDLGLERLRSFRIAPVHVMSITDGATISQKLAQVRSHSSVLYAEPDYIVSSEVTPNDPMFESQWALHNTGQTAGTPGADISAKGAWSRTTGSAALIAVIDSGIDYTHGDLAGNMWSGVGYDFFNDDDDPMDDYGHGTHVAGTIGAVGNNGLGIAGVNWSARLMALKFLGAAGFGFTSDAILAVEYAWQNGARISNNSWGSYGFSQALFDAINVAGNNGHLFIAAAGNAAFDNDILPFYPASYSLNNIISVASSDHNDARSAFSNYGKTTVHLAAPGSAILSTLPGGAYGSASGTSMAAPHVAGVAGLILAQNPGLDYSAIKQMILNGVDKSAQWENLTLTGGRLNAARSVGGRGTVVAYFTFNDGGSPTLDSGATVEDFTVAQDWENDWYHAGTLVNDAEFSDAEFFDARIDSNGDGIPDWWYEAYGFDPFGASIALEDSDGDGLLNLYEYLAGTHPHMPDSNMDGTSDANTDSNGDGLTNLQKQELGLHPLLDDTDDDGLSDLVEVQQGTDPLNPDDPQQFGAVSFSGNGRLLVRTERDIDVHTNWTVEAWVRPANDSVTGIVLRRAERFAYNGLRWIDYELGLENGIPYIRYAYRQGAALVSERVDGIRSISADWTHIAAVMDHEDQQLRLYVNGKRVAYQRPAVRPPISVYGAFDTTIGGGDMSGAVISEGFNGAIDAVRTWNYARGGLEIQMNRDVLLPEFDGSVADANRAPIRIFNFDSRGLYAHNSRYTNDWMSGSVYVPNDTSRTWIHAAEFHGDAARIDAEWPPRSLDSDDDTVTDHDENTSAWAVYRSEIPLRYRALSFDGVGDVFVDELVDNENTKLYALTNWTIEAWIRPTDAPLDSITPVVSRRTAATGLVTFELGLINDGGIVRPYARFQRDDAGNEFITLTHNSELSVGSGAEDWTHLAASFEDGLFSLYLNGAAIQTQTLLGARPAVGDKGYLLLGSEDFIGHLQEVRIWNDPRTPSEIEESYRNILLFSASLLESSFDGAESYIGRNTSTNENGLTYDYSFTGSYEGVPYLGGRRTHKFAIEAWVRMDPGSLGGIVAERKIDLQMETQEADWRVNHSLRITPEGNPQGQWQGEVYVYVPDREDVDDGDDDDEGSAESVVVRLDIVQEVVTRNITSEVDIRDGEWHHLALVGDSQRVRLYIDGTLDREISSYYTFRVREGEDFEGFYYTYMPRNSVLRVADGDLQAVVDEVVFWNEDITTEEVRRHRDYGLDKATIKAGLAPIEPLPTFALDPGGDRHRLVSYLTFDGEFELPFVPDRANQDMDYRILPLATMAEIINPSTPPIVVDRIRTFDRQLRGYFATVDGGEHVENYMQRNDWGHAGLLRGTTSFVEQDPDTVEHLEGDSDGDGLPDWWETLYGLDPGSADGDDGRWGDPDGDGLANIYEFLAGTDPLNWDSAGDGFSDYDSIGPGMTRPWGALYDDGDGMADEWETRFSPPLSPQIYDGHLDPDGDGWSNFAEFMGDTNPTDVGEFPRPNMSVRFNYQGPYSQGPLRIHFYDEPSMDGVPIAIGTAGDSQDITAGDIGSVDEAGQTASGTLSAVPVVPGSVSIRAPWPNGIQFVDQGDGVLRSTDVSPIRFGQIDYDSGSWQVNLAPSQFTPGANARASWSYFTGVSSYPFDGIVAIVQGHLHEGNTWAFAFIDREGTGDWNPGDPAGLAQEQPINVGWGDVPTVTFGLTDDLPGYYRFRWDPIEGQNTYTASVRNISMSGGPIVFSVTNRLRNYVHEGDYQRVGLLGLTSGATTEPGFQWKVNASSWSPTFTMNWSGTPPAPVAVYPQGPVVFARNKLRWTMSDKAVSAHVQIRRDDAAGPLVYEQTHPVPFPRVNAYFETYLPLYAGDMPLTNGTYVWRIREGNPRVWSPWSDYKTFQVALSNNAGSAYAISGNVNYFGPAPATDIIVQAFTSPGFSGKPDAQITMTNAGPYTLMGLLPGVYHVRAFIDQNPVKTLQEWESWGFVKDYIYGSDYDVKAITLPGNKVGQHVVIRDRDANQNGVPDSWEFSMGLFGGDSIPAWNNWQLYQVDSSGDGLSDGQKIDMGLDPYGLDADGDGFSDAFEIIVGTDPLDPGDMPVTQTLFFPLTITPDPPARDVIEINANTASYPVIYTNIRVRVSTTPSLTLMPFMPLPASDRVITVVDWPAGPWVFTNTPPQTQTQFYRLDWKIE